VVIDGCNINFFDSYASDAGNGKMLGICVDPYTSGRTAADRVKIKKTNVNVINASGSGRSFFGNHVDFTDIFFTSTKWVVNIPFLFKIDKEGTTITFSGNNKLITTSETRTIGQIDVNNWLELTDVQRTANQTVIRNSTNHFGDNSQKYGDLEKKYRDYIELLFDQVPNNTDMQIKLCDWYYEGTSGRANGTPYNEGNKAGDIPIYDTTTYVMKTANPKTIEPITSL